MEILASFRNIYEEARLRKALLGLLHFIHGRRRDSPAFGNKTRQELNGSESHTPKIVFLLA
jgi:hypothetical protein